jgi:predicted dehydrogenase
MLTIPGGHSLDTLRFVMGPFLELSATLSTTYPEIVLEGQSNVIHATAPDHVLVQGRLASGCVASVEVCGSAVLRPKFYMTVIGSEGALEVQSVPLPGLTGMQMAHFEVIGHREANDAEILFSFDGSVMVDPSHSVERMYHRLESAIYAGSDAEPSFEHALETHEVLEAVAASSVRRRQVKLEQYSYGPPSTRTDAEDAIR